MLENTEGAIKKDNQKKVAKYGTQDEVEQNKLTRQDVFDTTIRLLCIRGGGVKS